MYAITIPGKIYHLLYPESDFTLCGFKAKRIDAPAFLEKARLHFVSVIPDDRSLCKHCALMQQRREHQRARQVDETAAAFQPIDERDPA